MKSTIVALTGLSGVGKTTFLRRLSDHVSFQHLTGGSLIATARDADQQDRDDLRHADLDENQRLLIEGFELARDPEANLVIMDGHVVIDGGDGLVKLPADVFRRLGITTLVHLEADPARIAAHRAGDTARARPAYDISLLSAQQEASRAHADSIATALGVEFRIVGHDDVARLASILRSLDSRLGSVRRAKND